MITQILPAHTLSGQIDLPASKSYSVRAFIIAACGGRSRIVNPSDCDDALAASAVAKALGAKVKKDSKGVWTIIAAKQPRCRSRIDVNESGTVLRLVLPLLALQDKPVTVIGQGSLIGRPNHHLIKALKALKIRMSGKGKNHSVPIHYKGGVFPGGKIKIDGSLSSQFISALLIACPRLESNSVIEITGKKVVSADYVTMTMQVLKKAGITVKKQGLRKYQVSGQQKFRGLSFTVPSDYGLAAFLLASGILIPSEFTLNGNLDSYFVQADGRILEILKRMGIVFKRTRKSIKVKGPYTIKGGTFSLKQCPDLLPVLSVLALFANKPTLFKDIAHVRAKESDRITDLRKELIKVGADIQETRDTLRITPRASYHSDVVLDSHGDHRLAMAFAVLGLKLGVAVNDMECMAKSYPGFLADLKTLGAKVHSSKH